MRRCVVQADVARVSPRPWLISSTSIFAKGVTGTAATTTTRGRLIDRWQVRDATIELYDLI